MVYLFSFLVFLIFSLFSAILGSSDLNYVTWILSHEEEGRRHCHQFTVVHFKILGNSENSWSQYIFIILF